MTREVRMMCGIILITVPTIQYVEYFLLTSLMDKGQRVHGKPTAPEFLPCRACPRGRNRYSFFDLPSSGRRLSSSHPYALVRSNRSAACGDSHFLGVLFLGPLSPTATQASGAVALIYAGAVVLALALHARCWAVACSSDELVFLDQ